MGRNSPPGQVPKAAVPYAARVPRCDKRTFGKVRMSSVVTSYCAASRKWVPQHHSGKARLGTHWGVGRNKHSAHPGAFTKNVVPFLNLNVANRTLCSDGRRRKSAQERAVYWSGCLKIVHAAPDQLSISANRFLRFTNREFDANIRHLARRLHSPTLAPAPRAWALQQQSHAQGGIPPKWRKPSIRLQRASLSSP